MELEITIKYNNDYLLIFSNYQTLYKNKIEINKKM